MPTNADEEDLRYLERARALAREGRGRVHPNPRVGCLVVQGGRTVGEGYHREFGGPHAEVLALHDAGEAARGATVYVSLEPCAHHGKTPPCTDALIEAGAARVVFGAADPGEESGGGAEQLRRAGIEVVGPILDAREARRDNPAFFHVAETGTPYVEGKLAISVDAGIAAGRGERTSLTGERAQERVHRLRSGFDGILVGATTVQVDDPLLTVRRAPAPRTPPARLVVDSRCRTAPGAALFRDVDEVPLHIFTTERADDDRVRTLEVAGARVHPVAAGPDGVSLEAVLDWCRRNGILSILCEGGGKLTASLLRAGLCHRLQLHVAPRLLGPEAVPAFPIGGPEDLLSGWRVVSAEANVGRDGILVLEPERK